MRQTKYASAYKTLVLGFDFWLCSEGDFLTGRPQSVNQLMPLTLTRVTGNLQPYSLLQAFFIRSHANERVLEPSSPAKGKVTIVFKRNRCRCIVGKNFSIWIKTLQDTIFFSLCSQWRLLRGLLEGFTLNQFQQLRLLKRIRL